MSREARRFEREIVIGGETYRACVAWRGRETDYGLLYFHPVTEAAGDREDRRALLAPSEGSRELTDTRLRELFEAARPLTVTERRFTAGDGRQWLVQNRGPVWAERSAAEGHQVEGQEPLRHGAREHVGHPLNRATTSVGVSALERILGPTTEHPTP